MTNYQEYDLYSVYQYPWMALNIFLILLLASYLTRRLLGAWKTTHDAFAGLSDEKKRNAVTYVILSLGTCVVHYAQIYGGMDILFRAQDTTTPERIDWMVFSVQCIMVLYVWELIYRIKIGSSLLIHHLITILLCQLVAATFFDTKNIMYLRFALMLGFYATLEQLSFVALFVYRLDLFPKKRCLLFFIATGQALILKTIVMISSVAYYANVAYRGEFNGSAWGAFWKIAFIPLLFVLYGAQLYACHILYQLGRRCRRDKRSVGVLPVTKRETTDEENGTSESSESENDESSRDSLSVHSFESTTAEAYELEA